VAVLILLSAYSMLRALLSFLPPGDAVRAGSLRRSRASELWNATMVFVLLSRTIVV
jgi:hypothetical protein